MESYWRNSPAQRQAKRLITLSPKNAKRLLDLNKIDLRLVTNLLTGHCPLRYHLKKIGKAESETCRYCENAVETAEHLLCDCPAQFCKRPKYLERATLVPSEIGNLAPKKIANFAKSLQVMGN